MTYLPNPHRPYIFKLQQIALSSRHWKLHVTGVLRMPTAMSSEIDLGLCSPILLVNAAFPQTKDYEHLQESGKLTCEDQISLAFPSEHTLIQRCWVK